MSDQVAPQCASCRFWFERQKTDDGLFTEGECRRRAPVRGEIEAVKSLNGKLAEFPIIPSVGWCGEHEEVRAASNG